MLIVGTTAPMIITSAVRPINFCNLHARGDGKEFTAASVLQTGRVGPFWLRSPLRSASCHRRHAAEAVHLIRSLERPRAPTPRRLQQTPLAYLTTSPCKLSWIGDWDSDRGLPRPHGIKMKCKYPALTNPGLKIEFIGGILPL